MKKIAFATLLAITSYFGVQSQISYGGTPPSFIYQNQLRASEQIDIVETGYINTQKLLEEDMVDQRNGKPQAIAVVIPTNIDIERTGTWLDLPNDTRIWKQTIMVPEANGIILEYDDFYIPEGGQLFIYNKDRSQLLGAYTEKTNPEGGKYSNEIVYGDELTLEYVESKVSDEHPRIVVTEVGYIYLRSEELRDVVNPPQSPTVGDAASCMINVACEEGDNWRKQIRSVVRLVARIGTKWYRSTGSFINNVNNDGAPYLLTADHCFFSSGTLGEFSTAHFYFNFQHPTCSNSTVVPAYQTLIGSELLVRNYITSGSDGLLLKLTEEIPESYNVYFNGWDVSNTSSPSGVVIHHPNGDVKKISTYTTATQSYTPYSYSNAYWRVYYSTTTNGHAVSQVGSSGSPLFNSAGLVIGTLTGGNSYCTYESGGGPFSPDIYGKLYCHWFLKTAGANTMKYYLAGNTDVTTLQGYDPSDGNSIDNPKQETVQIVVFYDSSTGEIYVNTRDIINNLKVFDINGRLIYETKDLKSSAHTISASPWIEGIYTFVVDAEDGIYSKKVLKK